MAFRKLIWLKEKNLFVRLFVCLSKLCLNPVLVLRAISSGTRQLLNSQALIAGVHRSVYHSGVSEWPNNSFSLCDNKRGIFFYPPTLVFETCLKYITNTFLTSNLVWRIKVIIVKITTRATKGYLLILPTVTQVFSCMLCTTWL